MTSIQQDNGSKYLVTDTLKYEVEVHAFKEGMTNYVRTITDNKVELIFQGTSAFTKGSKITVPDVELFALPNMNVDQVRAAKDQIVKLRAYIYHEVATILYTHKPSADTAAKDPYLHSLYNALEAPRVNKRIGDKYLGAKEVLKATLGPTMADATPALLAKDGYTQVTALLYSALEFDDYQDTALWRDADPEVIDRAFQVLPLARLAMGLQGPEVLPLVRQVYEKIKDLVPPFSRNQDGQQSQPQPQPQAGQQGQLQGQGRQGQGQGGTADKAPQGDAQQGKGSTDTPSTAQKASSGRGSGMHSQVFDPCHSLGVDISSEAQDVLALRRGVPGHQRSFVPHTTEFDRIGTPEEILDAKPEIDRVLVQRLHEEARQHFGVVLRWLKAMLQAASLTKTHRGLDAGSLDPNALHKFAMGQITNNPHVRQDARNIFSQQAIQQDLKNTAVGISMDASSSMGGTGTTGTRARTAAIGCICIAEALEMIRVPYEITSWTTNQQDNGASTRIDSVPENLRQMYSRYGGLQYVIFKKYEDDWKRTMHRLAHAGGYGYTYDTEGILRALLSLAQRKEKRKILFVFTDGETFMLSAEDRYCEDRYKQFKHRIVQMAASLGIELFVFGIGTGCRSVKEYFPNYAIISNPAQLPEAIMGQLKKYLLGGSGR